MAQLSRTYRKWDSMIGRCYRKSHPAYKYYGARGITVCARWRESFQNFLADMGEAPPGLWLDRRNGDKPYEPGNCRWVTPKVSAQNKRQRQPDPGSIRQRAKRAGLDHAIVHNRIARGWALERALNTPKLKKGRQPGHYGHYKPRKA